MTLKQRRSSRAMRRIVLFLAPCPESATVPVIQHGRQAL